MKIMRCGLGRIIIFSEMMGLIFMDAQLRELMEHYLRTVDKVCVNLLEAFSLKTKEELLEYKVQNHIWQTQQNGIQYAFHGIGCAAWNDEFWIDWDFCGGSRWCGIKPWFLAMTLKENHSVYAEKYDANHIKELCEQAAAEGEMIKRGEQYFFAVSREDTFRPEFPGEFDTLVIERFEYRWVIKRDRAVDRFLRKSIHVSNQIYNNPYRYTLRFFQGSKEVYAIPYDDIGYPESAVRIMSNEIIQKLKSQAPFP